MASDPEFAAKEKAKRKKYADSRRAALKANPEKAAKEKERARQRRIRQQEKTKALEAELAALKAKLGETA